LDKVFTDKASGKDTNRPQLQAALNHVRPGDTLIRHIAETGEVLTEAQVSALEKKQDDDIAMARLKLLIIQDILAARTPSTWERSRV
jgi:hypothetical protein